MKKIFFTAIFAAGIFFQSHAQVCTPMWADTGYGIIPDTTINLPPAYAGSPYDAVVQFKTPPSTIYNNAPLTIDHVVLTNVDGLSSIPASVSFYFQCNPSDCNFHSDSVGCVRIQGTPTTPGVYPLTIDANVYITPNLFLPFPTPGYRIVVNNAIGIPAVNRTGFDVSQNTPNPITTKADVYVNLEHAGDFTMKISNLVGNEMLKQNIIGKKGLNTVNIDASRFAPGIYFYTVSDGTHSLTRRMVVDHK